LADLEKLKPGSVIAEIGSGVGFLQYYFYELGFEVIGIEPGNSGFDEMFKYQEILKSSWKRKITIDQFDATAENFKLTKPADYIYSINVMEHVYDIPTAMSNIAKNLGNRGYFRFICPNYNFPYEPHFGIFAPMNKKITFLIHNSRILDSPLNVSGELWTGLNWITTGKIKKSCPENFSVTFSREAFSGYFDRLSKDSGFLKRKGIFFKLIAIFRIPISYIFKFMCPKFFLPVMDVKLSRSTVPRP
jgi:SAM-dependent methyltransferase